MIFKGLGLPNAQWRTYDAEEEAATMALRPDGLLILGYPGSSVLSEKIAQERQLYEALDKPKVLLRPYAPSIITFKPWEWASVCIEICKRYQDAGVPVECIPGNEFNIEAPEGSTEDWGLHVHWLREFAGTFRKFQPDVRLHLPALSPTGNYLQGLWALSEAKLDYDVVDLHCYSTADLNDVLVCSGLFDKPICVTEINRVSPAFYAYYFRDAGDILEGAYWFILRWETPEPGAPNVDLIGSPYFAEFQALPHSGETRPADFNPGASVGIPELQDGHEGGDSMAYLVGEGIRLQMELRGEKPVEDEHYLGDREAYCASDQALYIYSKASNRIARIPFLA